MNDSDTVLYGLPPAGRPHPSPLAEQEQSAFEGRKCFVPSHLAGIRVCNFGGFHPVFRFSVLGIVFDRHHFMSSH